MMTAARTALVLLGFLCVHAWAGPQRMNVPLMPAAPVIDGKISGGEWDGASGTVIARGAQGRVVSPAGHLKIGRVGNTLYLAGWVNELPQMPVANQERRDGNLWEDDGFQISLRLANNAQIQLIVNARGTIYDTANEAVSWDGPWQVATSLIGRAESIGEGSVERGFAFEAALPLDKAGFEVPADGGVWGLQAALLLSRAAQATWNGAPGRDFQKDFGELVWGGAAASLDELRVQEEGRRVELAGRGQKLHLKTANGGAEKVEDLPVGTWKSIQPLPGGSQYTMTLEGEAYSFSFNGSATLSVPVVAVSSPSNEAFYIGIYPEKIQGEDRRPLELSVVRDGKELWRKTVELANLKSRQIHWVSYRDWERGWYEVVIERKQNGKPVELGRVRLNAPVKPEWANFQMPENAPLVPKPFTAVEAQERSAKVYGRSYTMGNSPFMDQVNSAGADILARPVELRGKVNHKPFVAQMTSWKLVSQTPEKAVWEGVAKSDRATLTVRSTLEFDGTQRFDWTLDGGDSMTVEDLALVVPVRAEVAKLYNHYFFEDFVFRKLETWNKAGALPAEGWSGRFTPFFWLGDHDRGIQWFAESRAGWTPRDTSKYITVERKGDAVELVTHLADERRIIKGPLAMTFGLIASPVRPRPSVDDWSGNRIILGHMASIFLSPNDDLRTSAIVLPGGPEDLPREGSVELVVRIDEAGKRTSLFQTGANSGGTKGFELRWNGGSALEVHSHGGPGGRTKYASWPVRLVVGKWHRVVFNYGPKMEVWVDGKQVGSADYDGPLQSYNRLQYQQIGGGGRISLAGWRLSDVRRPGDFGGVAQWKADANTLHLERMAVDPSIMGVTDPEVGGISNPGYLRGDWSYDAKEKCLVAGPWREQMTRVEHLHKYYGARNAIIFHWSKNITGHGGPNQTELLPKLFQITRAMNFRLMPYTPNGIIDKDPAYADYKYEFSEKDPSEEPRPWWTELGQRLHSGPQMGDTRNYELYRINEIMKLGFGGLYMDGWFYANPCSNPLLGAEAIDPVSGKPVPYFPIFFKHDLMKDVARIMQAYDPDALLFAHNSLGVPLPLMTFVTDALNGESLAWHKDWPKYVEPDVMQAEHVARAFGYNSCLFGYQNNPMPAEYTMAIAGVHGMTGGCNHFGMYQERAEWVWKLADRFGTETAQWMPFYKPEQAVLHPLDSKVLASAFVHPGQRALVVATNWSDEACNGRIKVDFAKLGLRPDAPVHVLSNNTFIKATDGVIELSLKPRRLVYVWIGENNGN